MKKIIVFGVGAAYHNKKYCFDNNGDIEVVAFIDNNRELQGTIVDGKEVFAPENVGIINYDVIVLLSVRYFDEQRKQLELLNVPREKIWDIYQLKKQIDAKTEFINLSTLKRNILIISYTFGIDGGSLAAFYLAETLYSENVNVVIAVDHVTVEASRIMEKSRISFVIHKSLPYMTEIMEEYVRLFDVVIVNTVQMLPVAMKLAEKGKKTYLWIHEGEEVWYQSVYRTVNRRKIDARIKILFVSEVSKELYKKYFATTESTIMPIALPDQKEKKTEKKISKKIKIALIAPDIPNKNIRLLLRMLKFIPQCYFEKLEINFVGLDDTAVNKMSLETEGMPFIKLCGLVGRSKIHSMLDEMDCVICTSLSESLSATAIEGFMHGCVVVVPNTAGVSKYIKNGIDGFVYTCNSEEELANCLLYILKQKQSLGLMKKKSRILYETYFHPQVLRNNIMELVGM